MLYWSTVSAGDARVSIATTAMERASTTSGSPGYVFEAKHSGHTRFTTRPTSYQQATKRAFRRARHRAQEKGGTYYRGRWHTPSTLGQLLGQPVRSSTRKKVPAASKPEHSMEVFSWNAGGASSAVYQEFQAWVTENPYSIVALQETHWTSTTEYQSGSYLCFNSGCKDDDKYAGVLTMLSTQVFDPDSVMVSELIQGRVLWMRARVRNKDAWVDVINVYQYAWRSTLSTQENLRRRAEIWSAIEKQLAALPSRNLLLLLGDFNCRATALAPHFGHSVPRCDSHMDADAERLVDVAKYQQLTALNTWHARPAHTFFSSATTSQIDFIFTRQDRAGGEAKHCKPLRFFPVAAWRSAGHIPLQARLIKPTGPWHRTSPPTCQWNVQALQQAVIRKTSAALACRDYVDKKLTDTPHGLEEAHSHVVSTLRTACETYFPKELKEDERISAHPSFRASARRVWQLYKVYKQFRGRATMKTIMQQWRTWQQFRVASKQLAKQTREIKKEKRQQILFQAEQAATRGDQRALYALIKQLTPKQAARRVRLRDPQGRALDKWGESQQFAAYSREVFGRLPCTTELHPIQDAIPNVGQALRSGLNSLGILKAVPKHSAPTAIWKLCSDSVVGCLERAVANTWKPGSAGQVHAAAKDTSLLWLPKPSKPPDQVSNLRPIGLICPAGKMLSNILRQPLREALARACTELPQFAYVTGRSTTDALLRVHQHFEDVQDILDANRYNRYQLHDKRQPSMCFGGICLSLDLAKAFDSVDREKVYASLYELQVQQDIIQLVKQFHIEACYHTECGPYTTKTTTSTGIKQGCKIAPFLWGCFSVSLLKELARRRSLQWVQQALTLFADDTWANWTVNTLADLVTALADLQVILEVLEDFGLTVNYTKTAVLYQLKGKQADVCLQRLLVYKRGKPYFQLQVNGRKQLLPIKDRHEYLGTVVTYTQRMSRNIVHRTAKAKHRRESLKPTLHAHKHISVKYRLRVWQACVESSLLYSLEALGVDWHGMKQLEVLTLRHLRAILCMPAHLTHTTNQAVQDASGLLPSLRTLLGRTMRVQERLFQKQLDTPCDITCQPALLARIQRRITMLTEYLNQPAGSLLKMVHADKPVPCDVCGQYFVHETAMRVHRSKKHQDADPLPSSRPQVKFQGHLHAVRGLPQCTLCGSKLQTWRNLKQHIETGACPRLAAQVGVAEEPTQNEMAQDTPFALLPKLLSTKQSWGDVLQWPEAKSMLAQHCAFCNMWIYGPRQLKVHIQRTHGNIYSKYHLQAKRLCQQMRARFSYKFPCTYCQRKVTAPGQHSWQCNVAFQVVLAWLQLHHGERLHGDDATHVAGRGGKEPRDRSLPAHPPFLPGTTEPTSAPGRREEAPLRTGPLQARRGKNGDAPALQRDDKTSPQTRRPAQYGQHGPRLCPFLKTGQLQCGPLPGPGPGGVAPTPTTGTLHDYFAVAGRDASLLGPGAKKSTRVTPRQPRGHDKGCQYGMASGGKVDLSSMEPSREEAQSQPAAGPCHHGDHAQTTRPARSPAPRGGDPEVHIDKSGGETPGERTFLLEVSTLGNPAWEVHQILQALVGSAVLSLVGGQLKKATQRRSDLAQRLQKLVLGGNGV